MIISIYYSGLFRKSFLLPFINQLGTIWENLYGDPLLGRNPEPFENAFPPFTPFGIGGTLDPENLGDTPLKKENPSIKPPGGGCQHKITNPSAGGYPFNYYTPTASTSFARANGEHNQERREEQATIL